MSFLELRNITKSFSGVEVLHGVELSLGKGEIRALLGANGAGKSTLMNIITGSVQADSGEILIDGSPVKIGDPVHAGKLGISMVHQELSVIPTMSVIHNMFLGRELKKHGIVDMDTMRSKYKALCEEYGFDIPGSAMVRDLSIAQRQLVEIMRAVSFNARLLILDEPTTALAEKEKAKLFEIVRQLRDKGTTIIYITHNMNEVFALADKATFLRNGGLVGTFPVSELDIPKISEYMSGIKSLELKRRSSCAQAQKPPLLEVEGLCRGNAVNNVSFKLYEGEVIGLAGLVGAGRSEIARLIFGADRASAGTVSINGKKLRITSPQDAVKNGICMLGEDRKRDGLILKHSLYRNAAITRLKALKRRGTVSEGSAKQYMSEAARRLSISMNSVSDKAENLSGGNQQKVVISKWLDEKMRVLIFDEPTKGIDILAKEDVFRVIDEAANQGKGIIFISSDIEEVLRVCDRILVICDGSVIDDFANGPNVTRKTVLDSILRHQEIGNEKRDS